MVAAVLATPALAGAGRGVGPAAPARRAVRARARRPCHAHLESVAFSLATPGGLLADAGVDDVARSSAAAGSDPVGAALQLRAWRWSMHSGQVLASSAATRYRDDRRPRAWAPPRARPIGAIGPYVAGPRPGRPGTERRATGGTPPASASSRCCAASVTRDDVHGLLLVALINPDALVSHMRLTLHDATARRCSPPTTASCCSTTPSWLRAAR
jgi:hypothetical protein